jgi:hypothetical protein
VEYFTGFFSTVFGSWGFDPIIADEQDQFRALEIAGYIGIMLAGAFPMVYLLTKYLAGPMEVIGARIGVSPEGAAGLLAASANILAMYRLVGKMQPRDKVLAIAFAVCAAFTFGDHLAFSANFQPTMILPLMLGKLLGGAGCEGGCQPVACRVEGRIARTGQGRAAGFPSPSPLAHADRTRLPLSDYTHKNKNLKPEKRIWKIAARFRSRFLNPRFPRGRWTQCRGRCSFLRVRSGRRVVPAAGRPSERAVESFHVSGKCGNVLRPVSARL